MSGPWGARRLHFVGVGGAGMSGYARAAHALGAQISGSDRAESPYVESLRVDGVLEASIGHDAANVPAGEDVEVVFSSAVPPENPERVAARARGLPERPRAELLGELTALKRTIAVAGTHGKTTTASMLVHILRSAGMEPAWMVGAPVGGGLPNARWSAGEWLVVEADESDRSMLSLEIEIAILTNVELDHHSAFRSLAELRGAFREFLAMARTGVVVWDRHELLDLAQEAGASEALEQGSTGARTIEIVPYDVLEPLLDGDGSTFEWRRSEVRVAVPGAHNSLNAAAALEASRLAGAERAPAIAGLAGFRGAGRRFQLLGRSTGGALVYDDYAHHPTEVAATLNAARTLEHRRLVAVFQPHLYSRTELLAREFGLALGLSDVVVVLDVYPARERAEDHPGVSGLRIAQAAADAARGRPVHWLPTFADAEPVLRGLLVRGGPVPGDGRWGRRRAGASLGRGEAQERWGRSGAAMSAPSPPPFVQRDFPLARLATVRTGGPAELFARVGGEAQLLELLAWAAGRACARRGGRLRLEPADRRRGGARARPEAGGRARGDRARGGAALLCGGGARLPAVAAHAARAGLSGIEFAVNIPGTVGGAVRMNANAYGGRLAQTLAWVELASASGLVRREPPDLGFGYRSSNLDAGEVVMRASFALLPARPQEVKATLAELRARRHEAQPQGDQDVRVDLQEPRGSIGGAQFRERGRGRTARRAGSRGGTHRGPPALRGRLQWPDHRRRSLRSKAR